MLTQSIRFLVVISLHLALPAFDSLFQLSVSIILSCSRLKSFSPFFFHFHFFVLHSYLNKILILTNVLVKKETLKRIVAAECNTKEDWLQLFMQLWCIRYEEQDGLFLFFHDHESYYNVHTEFIFNQKWCSDSWLHCLVLGRNSPINGNIISYTICCLSFRC